MEDFIDFIGQSSKPFCAFSSIQYSFHFFSVQWTSSSFSLICFIFSAYFDSLQWKVIEFNRVLFAAARTWTNNENRVILHFCSGTGQTHLSWCWSQATCLLEWGSNTDEGRIQAVRGSQADRAFGSAQRRRSRRSDRRRTFWLRSSCWTDGEPRKGQLLGVFFFLIRCLALSFILLSDTFRELFVVSAGHDTVLSISNDCCSDSMTRLEVPVQK